MNIIMKTKNINHQIDYHNTSVFLLLWKPKMMSAFKLRQRHIKAQIKLANKLVKSWPKWKQNILEQSLKPTLDKPRPYVNNV